MAVKKIVIYALLIALLTIVTITIVIPIPPGLGYINISDAFIMMVSSVLPLAPSMFIAGVGCMLADIILGYNQYAIFTLVVKALEALAIVLCLKQINNRFIAFALGAFLMVVGYGFVDVLLSGSFEYFGLSVMANLPQAVGCYVIGILCQPFFKKIFQRYK